MAVRPLRVEIEIENTENLDAYTAVMTLDLNKVSGCWTDADGVLQIEINGDVISTRLAEKDFLAAWLAPEELYYVPTPRN